MLGPSGIVRRQAKWLPSAVIAAGKDLGPIRKDPSFCRLLFPVVVVYLTQVCTGYDATLTSNLNSLKEWKLGNVATNS